MRSKQERIDRHHRPFVMIPKVFYAKFNPTHLAQGAYAAIRYFASTKTGTSEYASIPTLAKHADISERSFQRGLAELVENGVLRVQRRTRKLPNGKYTNLPNLYEIIDLETVNGEDDAPI